MFGMNRSKKRPKSNRPRKLLGQKPPLKLREVWAIRIRLQLAGRLRDLALFNFAIDSTIRYLGVEVDDALEIAEQTDA